MQFKDHFSRQAADYAQYRPTYPAELFVYLASLCPERETAWDCGTGNGQAALGLADHFQNVIASDPSEKQIANAVEHPQITYRAATAEQSGIPENSVYLITAAQALHWFHFDKFYKEVRRVLKPSGILAVWCYYLPRFSPEIDAAIDEFYTGVVGSYWPPERKWVDDGYRSLPFPFEEIEAPQFYMVSEWDFQNLAGYLNTWSAMQQFIKQNGFNPLEDFLKELQSLWGNSSEKKNVNWPFYLKIGKL